MATIYHCDLHGQQVLVDPPECSLCKPVVRYQPFLGKAMADVAAQTRQALEAAAEKFAVNHKTSDQPVARLSPQLVNGLISGELSIKVRIEAGALTILISRERDPL